MKTQAQRSIDREDGGCSEDEGPSLQPTAPRPRGDEDKEVAGPSRHPTALARPHRSNNPDDGECSEDEDPGFQPTAQARPREGDDSEENGPGRQPTALARPGGRKDSEDADPDPGPGPERQPTALATPRVNNDEKEGAGENSSFAENVANTMFSQEEQLENLSWQFNK